MGSVPGSGRSPGRGNENPLQYSFLENFLDRRVWQAMIYGVAKSQICKGIQFSNAVTYIKLTSFGANQAASEPCKTHKKQRQTKGSSVDTESVLP